MIDLQDDIKNFRFRRKGIINIVGDKKHPTFTIDDPLEKCEGIVYLWVTEINSLPDKILYVGKAGKTLLKRCGEHIGGFRGGSKKGLKNANELLKLLTAGTQIAIYARESQRATILGQDNISLCEAEEKSLVERYKNIYPLFNKL
jgi:hypothetical protein